MTDKLIPVNDYVSVKASQIESVTTAEYPDIVRVHMLSGEVHELRFSGGKFAAKNKFVQQVNDALAGE